MSEHQKTVWVLNCGSSSIKFAFFQADTCRCHGMIDNINSPSTLGKVHFDNQSIELNLANHDYAQAMRALIDTLRAKTDLIDSLSATGHRVVHGGAELTSPCVVDQTVLSKLENSIHLAPLHNPANILGIETCRALLPNIPHVVVFDTAFHQTIPDYAAYYALPFDLCQQHGIRKYGFHGISYDYVCGEVAHRLDKPREQCNMLIAHLGNGASICAIREGKSVDTSMGMTPLAGLPMGTRCGDIDPSIIPTIAEVTEKSLPEVMDILTKQSGLLGLSGISHDMRELVKAKHKGHPQAILALKVFAYRIATTMASYMPTLQNLDAIVFTGGIGENNPWLRQDVADHLAFLNIAISPTANAKPQQHDGLISTPDSTHAYVIATQEEQHIADITLDTIKEV